MFPGGGGGSPGHRSRRTAATAQQQQQQQLSSLAVIDNGRGDKQSPHRLSRTLDYRLRRVRPRIHTARMGARDARDAPIDH